MGADIRYFLTLLRMTFKSALSQRSAILMRGVFATVSQFIYFPIWYVMFSISPTIGGWGIEHAILGYGLSSASWGLVALFAYGLRTIPHQIEMGELDGYLTLPRPVLLSAAMSTSRNSGFGEFAFGVGLIIFGAIKYGYSLVWIPFFLLNGAVVFASGILFFATFGFWIRRFYFAAEEIYFTFNLMGSRPAPIFTGLFKVLTLTLIPVGFMTHVPIDFMLSHRAEILLFAVTGTIAYAGFAIAFFHKGLRYYESGSRFGVKG